MNFCTKLFTLMILGITVAIAPLDTIVVIEQGKFDDQVKNVTVSLVRFDRGDAIVEFANQQTQTTEKTEILSSNRRKVSIKLPRGDYEVTLILINNDSQMSEKRIKLNTIKV